MEYKFKFEPYGNYPETTFAKGTLGNNEFDIQVHRIFMAYDPYKYLASLIFRYRFLIIPLEKTDIASSKIEWITPDGIRFNLSKFVKRYPAWHCIDWGGPHKQSIGYSCQLDYPVTPPYIQHFHEETHATILVA